MPASILALRHKDGAQHQVYRYSTATPTLVGSAFGTARNTFSRVEGFKDRVIQFGGQIYVAGDDGIWKKDDPTTDAGTFTQVVDFTPYSPRNNTISGLHIFERHDDVYLALCFESTTTTPKNRWYAFTMPLSTGIWSASAAGELDGTNADDWRMSTVTDITSFGGKILLTGYDVSTTAYHLTFTIDPFAKSMLVTRILYTANVAIANSFGRVGDRLFMLSQVTSTRYFQIAEFDGSGWQLRLNLDGILLTTNNAATAHTLVCDVLWPDSGNFIYAFLPNVTDNGYWACLKIDTTDWSYTNISNSVLPVALRPQTVTAHMGVRVVVDRITNPATPDYLLYLCTNVNNVGTNYDVYKWNGDASLITLVDTGGAWHDSFPSSPFMGGERDFLPGSMSIINTGTVPTLGGMIYKFRAYGGGASADKVFRLKRLDATGALVNSTLSAASGGSAVLDAPNKKVTGIQADGSIEYSVTFDFTTDGFAVGGKAKLAPEIALS